MSVYKPAKSRFFHYDFRHQGRRYYGSTGCETKRTAEAVERKTRADAALGKLNDASQMTLETASIRWWNERGRDLRSWRDRERQIEVLLKLIGPEMRLVNITVATVSEAIERRRAMPFQRSKADKARRFLPSNTTVNRDIISALRPILRRARRRWGAMGLPEIDWGELELPEPKPKPKDFTDAEIDDVVAAVPPYWHDLIRFAARYGCRLSELFFSLADLDVADRDNARVKLRDRKGADDHTIPLLPADAAMLAARAGRARAADLKTVWFRELKSGKLKALAYGGAESAIRRAMTATGLRAAKGGRGPHDLRHHSGMRMLRATGNLRLTQRLLGHASIQSTMIYAHAAEGDLKAGLAAASRAVPEPENGEAETSIETKVSA